MKIISTFKDYYDHIAHIYGEDNKIVYLRQDNKSKEKSVKVNINDINSVPGRQFLDIGSSRYYFEYLVVCGKLYLMARDGYNTIFKLITDAEFTHILPKIFYKSRLRNLKPSDLIDHADDFLIKLSKLVGLPVFTYSIRFNYEPVTGREVKDPSKVILAINDHCPNLSEIGLSRHYPPDQLYQDISYFITNILNESADSNPPVELGNECKIVKHGFDLVKSFRHRK